jgi:hypothetical protein
MSTDGLSLLGLAAKRVKRDPSVILHPLTYGTLQVLDFVGPGHYLYVSLVSKAWHEAYKSVQSVVIPCVRRHMYDKPELITCAPSMTSTSAVFASPARVRFAAAAYLKLSYWLGPWISVAASTADVATLATACELGLSFDDIFLRAVAQGGRVTEMTWLHIEQRLSLPRYIIDDAAGGGHVDMLVWLYNRGCELTIETSRRAATNGHLDALKYLFSAGCVCDQRTGKAAADSGNVELLQWMRQSGVP